MYLQVTDVIAIIIALGSACTITIISIRAHRKVLKVNAHLVKTIRILQSQEVYKIGGRLKSL